MLQSASTGRLKPKTKPIRSRALTQAAAAKRSRGKAEDGAEQSWLLRSLESGAPPAAARSSRVHFFACSARIVMIVGALVVRRVRVDVQQRGESASNVAHLRYLQATTITMWWQPTRPELGTPKLSPGYDNHDGGSLHDPN